MDSYKERVIDQIERQTDHILRMYQKEELRDKMIELAREWYCKGLKKGFENNMVQ